MDSPFSDTCFEHVSRQKELLMLHQLRKQNSAVDDALFPYGLVLADLPPWEVQSIVHDQYTVGLDVERTVTYVSAALDYINRKSRRLGTDAWLFCVDRNLNQVSWSHELFVPYQYDQAVAEQRIGKILMVAKIEQSKIDANSIPWKNTCPDGTNLSGQLRWFPHRYEQHTDLLLNYNFLIVQNEYHLGDLCGGRYLRVLKMHRSREGRSRTIPFNQLYPGALLVLQISSRRSFHSISYKYLPLKALKALHRSRERWSLIMLFNQFYPEALSTDRIFHSALSKYLLLKIIKIIYKS